MLEIERKFLFGKELPVEIIERAERHQLTIQWYLDHPDRRRIRLGVDGSEIFLLETLKSGGGLVREEEERYLDPAKITEIAEQLKASSAVIKTRHIFPQKKVEGVIDLYLLPELGYVFEVETFSPNVRLPDPWEYWMLPRNGFREVTEDPSYTARSLAVVVEQIEDIFPINAPLITKKQIEKFKMLLKLVY
ncbi:hypothetical protein Y697_06135 [Mesotoga sp. BH458_6_3_2_1]|nr:hypothetical protein Y697_06135 [Mesotoga sp. BH458_6_3_2_1]